MAARARKSGSTDPGAAVELRSAKARVLGGPSQRTGPHLRTPFFAMQFVIVSETSLGLSLPAQFRDAASMP
jgi:hypothetical protein